MNYPVYLSPRERDVMALISKGLTDKEIAEQLHLSDATIKFHLNNIGVKLGFRRRVLLARWWWENREEST